MSPMFMSRMSPEPASVGKGTTPQFAPFTCYSDRSVDSIKQWLTVQRDGLALPGDSAGYEIKGPEFCEWGFLRCSGRVPS